MPLSPHIWPPILASCPSPSPDLHVHLDITRRNGAGSEQLASQYLFAIEQQCRQMVVAGCRHA